MSAASRLFVYGSLRSPKVREALLKRQVDGTEARLRGFSARPLSSRAYPGLVRASNEDSAIGLLLHDITELEWQILDEFEDEYDRTVVQVAATDKRAHDEELNDNTVTAFTYVWRGANSPTGSAVVAVVGDGPAWDYDSFAAVHLDKFIVNTTRYREYWDSKGKNDQTAALTTADGAHRSSSSHFDSASWNV